MPVRHGLRIGTAGWSIPKRHAAAFPQGGSHLERYAHRLAAVEINSSFYRPHRPGTYARWAASVPPHFRFAVKLPREVTHVRKLAAATEPLDRFLSEAGALGSTLGPLLVQLPPSLRFEEARVASFFEALRDRFEGDVVCEPRHASWFTEAVERLMRQFRVARVAADPALVPLAAVPGGWPGIAYHRLHGSPRIYHSAYSPEALDALARLMTEAGAQTRESWCIFDNTALGEATCDALGLLDRVSPGPPNCAVPAPCKRPAAGGAWEVATRS